MSTKLLKARKRSRRLRTPIKPIHVEELLAGAGMSGFLGILDTPVLTPHLQELIHGVHTLPTIPRCHAGAPKVGSNLRQHDVVGWDAESSVRAHSAALPTLPRLRPAQHAAADPTVASVVLKVQALMELIEATAKNCCGETKMDAPLPHDIQSERS